MNSRATWLGVSNSEVLIRLLSEAGWGYRHLKAWPGLEDLFLRWLNHMAVMLILLHLDLSTGLLGCPCNMVAGFLQPEWSERKHGGSCSVLYKSVLIITDIISTIRNLSHRPALIHMKRIIERYEHWWPLEAGYHTSFPKKENLVSSLNWVITTHLYFIQNKQAC